MNTDLNLCLILAASLSGLTAIASDWNGRRQPLFYVAKPLTTLLVIGLAWVSLAAEPAYQPWVMAALLACLLGDIALMFTGTRAFVLGLGSFLLGHVLFIAAFAVALPLAPLVVTPAACLAAAVFLALVLGYARWLLPRTGKLKLAVCLYMAALTVMVLVALLRAALSDSPAAWWVCLGAVLFAASDSVLAYRKFVAAPWWGQPVTLLTYYLAIGLVAWAH